MIKENTPACPVGCKYCMVNFVPTRYNRWKERKLYGINKTLTFINPDNLEEVDFSLLEYDYVGYQGINDPFNPIFEKDLKRLVEVVEEGKIKKLVLVTKIPKKDLSFLSGTRKVQVVVSITGISKPVEMVSTESRVEMVYRLVDIGLEPMVFIHPYIHTFSDLTFLKDLSPIKDKIHVSYKGFRYNRSMSRWLDKFIDEEVLRIYKENENEEILIGEDYLKRNLKEFRVWNFRDFIHFYKTERLYQNKEEARVAVKKLMELSVVSSSDPNNVACFAFKRRTEFPNIPSPYYRADVLSQNHSP